MYLANQIYPEDSIGLYNTCLDATQEIHGYLVLDLTQHTNDGLRVRTNIFPTDMEPLAVYSDIGDEACEIKLSYPPNAQNSRT